MYEDLVNPKADRIALAQERLIEAQKEMVEAYKQQWIEMNNLIEMGQWPEKAVFRGNVYGLRLDEEMYVFQLSVALPFVPNPYYWRFKEYHDDFLAAKLLVSLKLRDVIEKLGGGLMCQPAALLVKHYYNDDVKVFDMDNKAKQVVINTLRGKLIEDDNARTLPFYSEETLWDRGNRTMLYLGPDTKSAFMEAEIAHQYSRINHLPDAIEGIERTYR